jgi:HrpA-like RNA helicase
VGAQRYTLAVLRRDQVRPDDLAAADIQDPGSRNPYTGSPYSSAYAAINESRKALPAYDHLDEVLKVYAPTGSGKTTQ